LTSSDADFAVIVRPHVLVESGWLKALLDAAVMAQVGIVSPTFRGNAAPAITRPIPGCGLMETFSLSFATLLIRGEMQRQLGGFDEGLDGAEWCLRDYIRRAESSNYYTCVSARPQLVCGHETIFGSTQRRQEQTRHSQANYLERWGCARHYCLYFGPKADAAELSATVETLVAAARQGHRFTLMLHRKQFKEFRRRGWNGLHTAVIMYKLPFLGAQRSLIRQFAALQAADPDLIPVVGGEDVLFPAVTAPICLNDIVAISQNNT
jgi:hypothetical protein